MKIIRISKIKYANQDKANQVRFGDTKSFRNLLPDQHLSRPLLCHSHHNKVGDNVLNLNKCMMNLNKCMMRCSYNPRNYQIIRKMTV